MSYVDKHSSPFKAGRKLIFSITGQSGAQELVTGTWRMPSCVYIAQEIYGAIREKE